LKKRILEMHRASGLGRTDLQLRRQSEQARDVYTRNSVIKKALVGYRGAWVCPAGTEYKPSPSRSPPLVGINRWTLRPRTNADWPVRPLSSLPPPTRLKHVPAGPWSENCASSGEAPVNRNSGSRSRIRASFRVAYLWWKQTPRCKPRWTHVFYFPCLATTSHGSVGLDSWPVTKDRT